MYIHIHIYIYKSKKIGYYTFFKLFEFQEEHILNLRQNRNEIDDVDDKKKHRKRMNIHLKYEEAGTV